MDDSKRIADPEEQLRILEKAYETTSSQLNHLESTIQKFISNFATQENSLTELYNKMNQQQNVYKNIVRVKNYIKEIQDQINTSKRLAPILQTNIEENFDNYMDAMNTAIESRTYLNRFQFEDAYQERQNLSRLLDTAKSNVLTFFADLANRSATAILITNFAFENGKFVITDSKYENPIYPVPEELLKKMNRMAFALDKIRCTEHISIYNKARIKAIEESLGAIVAEAKKRVVLPGPLNVLDLPTYQKHQHPVHTVANLVGFFYKRERAFALAVFGDKYQTPFNSSFTPCFAMFIKIIDALQANVQAHIDILLEIDLVGTIVEVLESLVNEEDFSTYAVQLAQLSHSFHINIERILGQFKSAVEHHDPNSVPASGGVSALVSNVILFLISLTQYRLGLSQVISQSLENYVPQVLAALDKNVREKSTHYTDIVLRQLFLMNNAHYAYIAIESKPEFSAIVPQDFKNMLENTIQDAQKIYMNETWNKAFAILSYNSAFDGVKKGQKLTPQQKSILKSKFKNFKEAVLEIQQKHNSYCLKNAKLMEPIMNEAISKTHSKFESFYMRWHDSGFANHPEKYTAVQPSTLEGIINRMYGPKRASKRTSL
ncbi:Exo70 exocyst complex subunit family protein [Trichomonas vaginalis G3]|uniref:Exocyst subunit Exo70 family protein n=1 Tax=Trichomonas vaginalis (strain ATCC PRA-98 / G3) TaxID=412133 RepID=A2FJ22_TRIV3|nr:exocytosis [Trichomonas vaginalis G3]EAX95086.1 Exo70 exocyst complex subunit family protein [Trichomonas vaginalis G3]KAI5501922.1 exocytosis [Trichomonas vaginalis G3]|eukprot:XP_001308016.1 Exo70 exocyst complex subunit family protein [Trichomonas vaginalis G3]